MGFCNNCGSEYKDGTVFCSHCGAKVGDVTGQQGTVDTQGYSDSYQQQGPVNPQGFSNPTPNTYANYSPEGKKPNNNKTIGIIVVAVAALLVILLLGKLFGSTKSYEKPIQTMASAIQEKSFKKLMKAFPDYLSEKLEDLAKGSTDNIDDYMDKFLESLEDQYGKKIKISYKVKDKEKLSKDEIKDLEENIKDNYDEKVDIKDAYKLEVDLTVKGSKDKETDEQDITVIKIGSKWYMADNIFN